MAEPRLTAPLQNFLRFCRQTLPKLIGESRGTLLNPSATKFVPLDARSGVH